MYPDLENNRKSDSGYGSTLDSAKKFQKRKNGEGAVFECSKCWITSIAIICILVGIFISGCALYTKYAYAHYSLLEKMLPHGAIWCLFGFGVTLALCAIVLIVAAVNYKKCICKVILLIFSIILMVLCAAEIISGSVFIYFLNSAKLEHSSGDNFISSDLFHLRQTAVDDTFHECCPYTGNYSTTSICKWPDLSADVDKECDKAGYSGHATSLNIYNCVCHKGKEWYGKYLGMFFSEKFMWVGGLTIAFTVPSLIALICSCVLLCKKHTQKQRMDNNLYHDTDFDSTHMN